MNGEWDVLEHDERICDGDAGEEEVDRLAEMEKAANLHEFLSEVGNCFFPKWAIVSFQSGQIFPSKVFFSTA